MFWNWASHQIVHCVGIMDRKLTIIGLNCTAQGSEVVVSSNFKYVLVKSYRLFP